MIILTDLLVQINRTAKNIALPANAKACTFFLPILSMVARHKTIPSKHKIWLDNIVSIWSTSEESPSLSPMVINWKSIFSFAHRLKYFIAGFLIQFRLRTELKINFQIIFIGIDLWMETLCWRNRKRGNVLYRVIEHRGILRGQEKRYEKHDTKQTSLSANQSACVISNIL